MSDLPPQEQDLDALAASLRADASDIGVFFQVLAAKLSDAMPGAVDLEREGGLFKKDHPVKKISLRAGDDVFEAELRHGAVASRHAHAVRGITLRSEELDFQAWLRALLGVLQSRAQSSAEASAALRSLVT
ncbi:MAG: hypothetical protein JF887_07130 [Candidatus Dormibacteraeota bacterium]|uniref:Uncharacterized protein n=1 Tax=Candidatus Amunia macphersoniae TaxID=3127014 RepID=A0A934KGR5_9BACT|nr:hypothetical protein [Candidatus Dormibacteraeota bacterium]